MINISKYILLFIFLLLFQELIFNNIEFSSFLTPYVYILFIIILPLQLNPTVVLLIAFLLGLCMDLISGGILGAHTAACVAMAYWRKSLIKHILTKGEYENIKDVVSKQMGLKNFFLYTLLLTILHHTVLSFIEVFSFTDIFATILRIIISAIISTIFIILIQRLFSIKNEL